jgi:hypothetical protein
VDRVNEDGTGWIGPQLEEGQAGGGSKLPLGAYSQTSLL